MLRTNMKIYERKLFGKFQIRDNPIYIGKKGVVWLIFPASPRFNGGCENARNLNHKFRTRDEKYLIHNWR